MSTPHTTSTSSEDEYEIEIPDDDSDVIVIVRLRVSASNETGVKLTRKLTTEASDGNHGSSL